MTKEEQVQLSREVILRTCHAASPASIPNDMLVRALRLRGLPDDQVIIDQHLSYLEDKGMVRKVRSIISVGAIRWEITAPGTEYLEAEGLS